MILSHPQDAARAAKLLPLAETAYAADKAWWPRPPGSRYVIIAPGSTDELGALIVADNADDSPDYLAHVRSPGSGYMSVPFAEDVELSMRTG